MSLSRPQFLQIQLHRAQTWNAVVHALCVYFYFQPHLEAKIHKFIAKPDNSLLSLYVKGEKKNPRKTISWLVGCKMDGEMDGQPINPNRVY